MVRALTWRVWLAFIALSIIWGLPYLFIKLAVAEIPPVGVAWGRLALGAAVLMPVAWTRGSLPGAAVRWRAVCAFAELVVPFPLISLGERWISSSLTARRSAGLACGFVGVVVLLGIDPVRGALGWAGVSCMLVAVVGYAIGSLIVQRYLHGVDEFAAVALSLAIATLLLPASLMSLPQHLRLKMPEVPHRRANPS